MATLATFNFTGTNGTTPPIGSGDSTCSVLNGNAVIQSNACQFTGISGFNKLKLLDASSVTQALEQVTITINNVVNHTQGIFFHQSGAVGSENGYLIYFDTGNWGVNKYSSGTPTVIQASTFIGGSPSGTAFYSGVAGIIFKYNPSGASPILSVTSGSNTITVTDSAAGKILAPMGVQYWSDDTTSTLSTIDTIVVAGTAASSNTVTLAANVIVGGTGYNATTTGLGTVTSLTNATITGTSANAFTYSMNSFQNGVVYLPMGLQTQTASDGTNSANNTSTIATMSGYTAVTLGTMNTGAWSLGKDTAFISGNVVHLPTAAGTLNTDGTLTDYVFGSYSGWMRETSTGKMWSFTLTVTNSGVSTSNLSRYNIGIGIGL